MDPEPVRTPTLVGPIGLKWFANSKHDNILCFDIIVYNIPTKYTQY